MSTPETSREKPKAVIHKRILDAAATNPDASVEDLAADISGASVELVQRILRRYGDPAEDQPDDNTGDELGVDSAATEADNTSESFGEETMSGSELPDFETLSEEQKEILRTIDRHPDATQAELAERLDVSKTTVNKRVNSIDGFEWSDREEIVSELIERKATVSDGGSEAMTDNGSVDALQDRITRLEDRIETDEGARETFEDPELVAKVTRACIESDSISEEEELRIIEAFLG